MTFAKKSLLTVAILLSTILIAIFWLYLARVALVKDISEEQLALYQAKISCLDFNITFDLKIEVSRLCLQTPQADINIEAMTITLDLAAKQKIKRIDITTAIVKGTAELFTELNTSPQDSKDGTLAQQLDHYLTQLSQVNLPFNMNVADVRYSPFSLESSKKITANNTTKTTSYSGQFSVVQNTVAFSLNNLQGTSFLTANFSAKKPTEHQLSAEFSGQLKPLKRFLFTHKLPVSPAILEILETVAASGNFQSVVNYQAGQLTLASQLKDLLIETTKSIEGSGPFTLTGALNLHSQVNLAPDEKSADNQAINSIDLEFQKDNILQLQFSHQYLIDYLSQNAISADIIKLLTDNPVDQLTFSPKGQLTYNLNNQKISLSALSLKAKIDLLVHQLDLNNIALDLSHYLSSDLTIDENHLPSQIESTITDSRNTEIINAESTHQNENNVSTTLLELKTVKVNAQNIPEQLAELDFQLDSPLKLSAMDNFTHSPIEIKLQGSISQNHEKTTISFFENSSLTSNSIAILSKQKTADKKLLSIKKFSTQIQGNVEIQSRMQVKNMAQIKEKPSITLNLNLNSQAQKLRAGKVIEIKTLAINTGVTGNLDDIKLNATATADNLLLGNLAISGAIDKPHFALTANSLQLTELLSLNIKLPKKVDLVDGKLSYSIKGQVTDFKNIQNTPLALSVAITSLSGEIDDIWIQELNWQQNFQFSNNEFSTLNYATENSSGNLTVALIDTPTPITKFSINTRWRYQKDFTFSATKLKGNILGGSFAIPKIQWPLDQDHSVDVQLTRIDLEQVLALDKKQGIVVTGDISGQLPIRYDGEKYTMEKGELHNVSNGLIQVINNPAVDKLKASNTQLKLAFDALQNLHYHQLSSDVSMADDGYMLLQTVIKGRNPDIDNDVNLNLNLSYDLLGLLESMSITEQFEERIIKGLQKH
ncbi:YdbH domain-containing protein [Cognaticolwellia beringensis]|uniref:Uncharacterized protein n=1 Tax=Cognaticolwellia beringensis TaxID=1967665 RepID=A0A222G5Z3_9GAMM|nr:YdbH domain-containing protein [Cognaticolwellia beringensis]ASP47316.1 hypothetical protein B5D82_05785 [Cognaticolwellia beringensis]